MEALIVITTVPDSDIAVKMAESIFNNRLAACIHQFPAGISKYIWQGKLETATEIMLFIKTSSDRYAALEQMIRKNHPFEVPEIIAIPVINGLPSYLSWIFEQTGSS